MNKYLIYGIIAVGGFLLGSMYTKKQIVAKVKAKDPNFELPE